MHDIDREFLSETTRKIGEAKALLQDRDARIAALIRYRRATVQEIMSVTGLTKSRIYQVFEVTYGFPASEIERRNGAES